MDISFIMDITGSMSGQLYEVKTMISKFLTSIDIEQEKLNVNIITYTENQKGSYVSTFTATNNEELKKLNKDVQNIDCSIDPFTKTYANGGDGDENVMLGLYKFQEMVKHRNNGHICFIITDASFHTDSSNESKAEQSELLKCGYQDIYDPYVMLQRILETLNHKIVFCPILYGYSACIHFYSQMALLTSGVVLIPQRGTSTLGNALTQIIKSLIHESPIELDNKDFNILDISEIDIIEKYDRTYKYKPKHSSELDEELLGLKRVLSIVKSGKKVNKRMGSINQILLTNYFKFVKECLLKLKTNDSRDISSLLDGLEDFDKNIMLNTYASLDQISSNKQNEVSCYITMESISEIIEELNLDDVEINMETWCETVMKVLFVNFVNIKFRKDSSGNDDLEDSWSAFVENVSKSELISAYSASKVRTEDSLYEDPLTRITYNSVNIISPVNDKLANTIYKIISSTPLLDIISTYMIIGSLNSYRNLSIGINSATLYYLLKTHDSEVTSNVIHNCINTIKTTTRPGVTKKLVEDPGPEMPISKIMTAFIRFSNNVTNETVKKLSKEWIIAERQEFDLKNIFPPENYYKFDIDVIKQQHPLEMDKPIINYESVKDKLSIHPSYQPIFDKLTRFFRLINVSEDMFNKNIYDTLFEETLLYNKRSERYMFDTDKKIHIKKEDETMNKQLIRWIKNEMNDTIVKYQKQRTEILKNTLMDHIKNYNFIEDDQFNIFLKNNVITLFNKDYRLTRQDAFSNKLSLDKLYTIIMGNWSSEPVNSLICYSKSIDNLFINDHRYETIKSELYKKINFCVRPVSNRLGHTIFNPGRHPIYYTEDYAFKRGYNWGGILFKMKEYKEYALKVLEEEKDSDKFPIINIAIHHFYDANRLDLLKTIINNIKRVNLTPSQIDYYIKKNKPSRSWYK